MMIVFWKESRRGLSWDFAWRCYKGSTKLRNGFLHIYPCNGTRKKLSDYVAFDDKTCPPRVISTCGTMGRRVNILASCPDTREHLPVSYIDEHGNIRRTDRCLSLLFAGPNWNAVQEAEFQESIEVPF